MDSPQMRLWVRLTFGQMYPLADEALGHVDIFVRSLSQVDFWSDVPPRQRHLMAKCDTTLGQVNIWSDLWVRMTFCQIYTHRWGFRSVWHLVRLWVRCTPTGRDILWPSVILLWVRLTFGQIFGLGWPLVRCTPRMRPWVRLTFDQIYPTRMRLQVRLTFGQTFGQADLWSDVPPSDNASGQVDM